MIIQKTLNMQNTTGYALSLSSTTGFGFVQLKAAVACVIQTVPVGTTAVAPGSDPSPSAGSSANWYKMSANEVLKMGVEAPKGVDSSSAGSYSDLIQAINVWSLGAGELDIIAH